MPPRANGTSGYGNSSRCMDLRSVRNPTRFSSATHARRRQLPNLCFTEKSLRAASGFMSRHVDRWNGLMLEENSSTTEWSAPVDLSEKVDALVFDVMGDLSLGRSFDIKEPGDNPLRVTPHNICRLHAILLSSKSHSCEVGAKSTQDTAKALTGCSVLPLSLPQIHHLAQASRV